MRMLVCLGLIAVVTGCAVSSTQDVPMPDPSVQPNPEMGRFYVYRQRARIEWHNPLRIFMDGDRIGTIGNDSYLLLEVPPGAKRIDMKLERTGQQDTQGTDVVHVKAGEVRYYEVRLAAGTRWPRLEAVSAAEGRDEVEARDPAKPR